MSLNRQAPQGTPKNDNDIQYENLEVGEHEGRLVYIADVGFHKREYMGDFKGNFQNLCLGIEIVGRTFTMDGVEKPVMMWTKAFPVYENMFENSGEFKMYSAFVPTAQDKDVPDWEAQLDKPVNVIVEHTPDKKDPKKVYDNVAALAPIPAKYHDSVAAATIAPAAGNGEDVQVALYGLAKWLFDNQLTQEQLGRDYTTEANADHASEATDPKFDDGEPF